VGGNNILIRHGTEAIRYCHFRKDSIPAALKTVGATALVGQELRRTCNSGGSSNPHTHIHVLRISDWALLPFPFRNAWVIDKSLLSPPSVSSPWYKLNAQGITAFRDRAQSLFDNDELRVMLAHMYLGDGVRKFAGVAHGGTPDVGE
jgi:hypothetical protein